MKQQRNYISITTALAALFFWCLHALSQNVAMPPTGLYNQPSPKHEVRAVWLTTIGGIDWPHSYNERLQRQELTEILDKLQQAHINTVLVQTRIRATTIYPSAYEPWDGCLSGKPGTAPDYDALSLVVDECHKRGMECHAWMVTIPVGKWNAAGCRELRRKHPSLIKKIGDDGYMDPENAQTASYLAKICGEVTRNYDIDGIHLDYIRYPETWKQRLSKAQGREKITQIVRAIHREVKAIKPWVKLSCSPIGKYDDLTLYRSRGWNARTTVCQDAQAWLREGLMDQLFPMMYFKGNNFYPFAVDWQQHAYSRTVAPGLAVYMLHPKEQNWPAEVVENELWVLRDLKLGHTFFRSKFLTDNTKGIYDFVVNFNKTLALPPALPNSSATQPAPPQTVSLNGSLLSWSSSPSAIDSDIYYNVYASREWPVDINDSRNIMAMRLKSTAIAAKEGLHYAVTAINRYGQESTPAGTPHNSELLPPAMPRLVIVSGKTLALPQQWRNMGIRYAAVETMLGQLVATTTVNNSLIDISRLPNGVYQLRSLQPNGVTHRIGFFSVKR